MTPLRHTVVVVPAAIQCGGCSSKGDLLGLCHQLAEALKAQATYIDRPDKENCWCAGPKHFGSVACQKARVALMRFSKTVGQKHE